MKYQDTMQFYTCNLNEMTKNNSNCLKNVFYYNEPWQGLCKERTVKWEDATELMN